MKKRNIVLSVVFVLLACCIFASPVQADIILYDWAVNIDSSFSEIGLGGDPIPLLAMDVSAFDSSTGLGSITVEVSDSGSHYVGLFVDHEMTEPENTFFNEAGIVSGSPLSGQSWEIDEPGFVFGDIYTNIKAGSLDNFNNVPSGLEDDVSMAIGWDFDLVGSEWVEVVFNLSETAPLTGFFLEHNDPDSGESVYFSSGLTVVPVPGAVLLGCIGLGFAGSLIGRSRHSKTYK